MNCLVAAVHACPLHQSAHQPPPSLVALLLPLSLRCRVVAGTSLAAVLATALTSTATFTSAGCLDLPASLLVCAPAVVFAPVGARLATKMDCAALKRLLGYFLLAAAPLIPIKSWLFAERGQHAGREAHEAATSGGKQLASSGQDATGVEVTANVGPAADGLEAAEVEPVGSQVGSWLQQLRQEMPSAPVAGGLLATGAAAGFASGLLGIGGGTVGEVGAAAVRLETTALQLARLAANPLALLKIAWPSADRCHCHLAAATPMVALLMPFSQATVLGTTLLAMIPPTAVGLLQHYRSVAAFSLHLSAVLPAVQSAACSMIFGLPLGRSI